MPTELAHLARDFENDILEAASAFGKPAVHAGKQMLLAELSVAGLKNSQVRYGIENKDTVLYVAMVNTPQGPSEIVVPVEMKSVSGAYVPLSPTQFIYGQDINDFSPQSLQLFAARTQGQAVYSLLHSYMTLPELRDEITKAASVGDYNTSEAILGTIQARYSEEDYNNAVADYQYILANMQRKTANVKYTCSHPIEAGKGSLEKRCSHLLVPLSKIIVGEDGICRLKSHIEKERLNPLNEGGAAISSSKLFWS